MVLTFAEESYDPNRLFAHMFVAKHMLNIDQYFYQYILSFILSCDLVDHSNYYDWSKPMNENHTCE